MTPIEAAVKAAHERGYEGTDDEGCLIMPFDERDARAIIAAFLEAAAEDENACVRVHLRYSYEADVWIRSAVRISAARAAILALKEAVG